MIDEVRPEEREGRQVCALLVLFQVSICALAHSNLRMLLCTRRRRVLHSVCTKRKVNTKGASGKDTLNPISSNDIITVQLR